MNLETTAWRLIGLTGSERGVLSLRAERLSFRGEKGLSFDIPLESLKDIWFPWFYFGGGFKMVMGEETYKFSFIEPYSETASIVDARRTGKMWQEAFDASK